MPNEVWRCVMAHHHWVNWTMHINSKRERKATSLFEMECKAIASYIQCYEMVQFQWPSAQQCHLKWISINSTKPRSQTHTHTHTHTHTTVLRDHPGEPVPEENFWTLWCKGRLTEADTPKIRLGATPSGLTSAQLHHPPYFLRAGCSSCRPTNSLKALKATSAVFI